MKLTYRIIHFAADSKEAKTVDTFLQNQGMKADIKVCYTNNQLKELLVDAHFDIAIMGSIFSDNAWKEIISSFKSQTDIPFIIISEPIGDEKAVELMKVGASDFLLKKNLNKLSTVIVQIVEANRNLKQKQELQSFQEAVINTTSTGLFQLDLTGNITYANNEVNLITGYNSLDELNKKGWISIIADADKPLAIKEIKKGITNGRSFKLAFRINRADGYMRWLEVRCAPKFKEKNLDYFIGSIIDISEFKETQDKLKEMARIDFLTHLPNRLSLQENLNHKLDDLKRYKLKNIAILYIDLDDFKRINDSYGHNLGDRFLINAGERFKMFIRRTDFVARVGGDEFVIILDDVKSLTKLKYLCDMLINKFKEPFLIDEHQCVSTLSIGVVLINQESSYLKASEIIQQGDHALYRAKGRGKNRIEFFTQELNQEIQSALSIEADLKKALKNNEFYLTYQPRFELSTNKMVGCEVLIRWQHPTKGLVKPDSFIPIAEDMKLMSELSNWVITEALNQFSEWKNKFPESFDKKHFLSINLSCRQLENHYGEQLVNHLNQVLKKIKLDNQHLLFEISESSVTSNIEHMESIFSNLHDLGISMAIDGFGKGYSSFAQLKSLPVTMLKVDKSFIENIHINETHQEITRAMIELAKALSLNITAEGVETIEQKNFLKSLNCPFAQGFLFAKPMTADEFERFVVNHQKSSKAI